MDNAEDSWRELLKKFQISTIASYERRGRESVGRHDCPVLLDHIGNALDRPHQILKKD